MKTSKLFLWFVFPSVLAFSYPIEGVWVSDCQNLPKSSQGFLSQSPVDTFYADGTATLLVHVFEQKNCKGKEWDVETIPCHYQLAKQVTGLSETRELNLECEMEGQTHHWYEIAEIKAATLRYGNHTGTVESDRPQALGSVVYRRK